MERLADAIWGTYKRCGPILIVGRDSPVTPGRLVFS